ncbi:ras-related and estrogen-regulated growth inhibitor-like [Babylonia areolata]|uniref:ras-related and estrogen-regulated growth inhibitor-like n=1 Tax=Babylonia areolata TaxID=304850 RepID=UPI003FD27AA7
MKAATSCLKVVILGAPQVGKSAVTVRFLTKRFIGEYSSGTDCTYQTMFRHDDATLAVEIVDTASDSGTDRFRDMQADALVIVYSITDRRSLKQARELMDCLLTGASMHVPVLLLGNKADLQHHRQVSRHDVRLLTHQYPCRHCEISVAESCSAVDKPMQDLFREGLENRRLKMGQVKRRRSLFENVSRRLGNVFRRKSLEEQLPKKKPPRKIENINRRSL